MSATFTDEELDRLIALLRKESGNPKSSSNNEKIMLSPIYTYSRWIMDSGATDHISKNSPIFDGSNPKHNFVKLRNGGKLSDDLTLK